MTTKIRMWIAGITVLALFVLVFVSGPSYGQNAPLKADVEKIAAAIKKGDDDGARKMAKTAVKKADEIGDVMSNFKPRKPAGPMGVPGLGWGAKGPKAKDGLELMVRELAKGVPADFDYANGEEASFWIAALADMAKAKGFDKYTAQKPKKDWDKFNDDMRDAAIVLAKASAGKNNAKIQAAATALNKVCINCHFQFKP